MTTPPSTPPPAIQPAKSSNLLLKILGVLVALFILKSMFSSKSTSPASSGAAGAVAQTAGVSSDDDPLVGTWTVVPPGDASCTEKVSFSHNAQGLHIFGNAAGGQGEGYAQNGDSVTIGSQAANRYGFNSFKITSPTTITKTWCSSLACNSCGYTKD